VTAEPTHADGAVRGAGGAYRRPDAGRLVRQAGRDRSAADESREEFDSFYTASVRRLTSAVYAMTGDLGEAEDAVQEAYARAWERWASLTVAGDPEPWVRTVAMRLAVSSWRRARNRLRAHFRHGPPPNVPELAPDHVALMAALRALRPDQRTAIVLHYLLDLPVAEVAKETGATPAAIRTRLSRGRKALGHDLTEDRHTSRPRPRREVPLHG
jgi:RNA polymerase sigma-70 factor (ECF subfamily)